MTLSAQSVQSASSSTRRSAGAVEELRIVDRAGVHAGAAACHLGAVPDRGAEHAIEPVVAVGYGLPLEGTAHGVAQQEDPNAFFLVLGQGPGEPNAVVGVLRSVGRSVEYEEGLHRLRSSLVAGAVESVCLPDTRP